MEIMSNLIKDLRSTKYYFVFRPIRPSLANLVRLITEKVGHVGSRNKWASENSLVVGPTKPGPVN